MKFETKHKSQLLMPILLVVIAFMITLMTTLFIANYSFPNNNIANSSEVTEVVATNKEAKYTVTITAELNYLLNEKPIELSNLKHDLESLMSANKTAQHIVIIHVDDTVPVEYLVNVADIASSLKAKVSIATKPKN